MLAGDLERRVLLGEKMSSAMALSLLKTKPVQTEPLAVSQNNKLHP
jgi:hypothetical protein